MNQSVYFRRRSKVFLPVASRSHVIPLEVVTTLSVNLEGYGYALSPELLEACKALSFGQLRSLQVQLVGTLSKALGADRVYEPMYPNFPSQVMGASAAELYFNAIVHYWSSGELLPRYIKKAHFSLKKVPELKFINLGSSEEFEQLFSQIVSSNVSFSDQDREDVAWFIAEYGEEILRLLPEAIPQRENWSVVAALLLDYSEVGEAFVRATTRTATDLLRLAVALSEGDVSLGTPTKFKSISRSKRRLFLSLLEQFPYALEDMLRWKERWKRLGERLHPGEFESSFPKAVRAFQVIRNDLPSATHNGAIENALREKNLPLALEILPKRPGDFARRLDHVLRLDESTQTEILDCFKESVEKISTPVLLQARHHFQTRLVKPDSRVFFLKGNLSKVHLEPHRLPDLPSTLCLQAASILELSLKNRFSKLPSLGRVFIDPLLINYPVPFARRSASKSLQTLPKGSRIQLPSTDTIRLFLWWKNGTDRTDIDLSAVFFGEDFLFLDEVAYYNLLGYGGTHSGDIVDAPEGASEFIDLSRSRLRELDVRYVAMVVNSYTRQPYVDLPECFAGWMAREEPDSGEVYEPRTVIDRIDLTAQSKVAIPIVFDLVESKAIWCDMSLRADPRFANNVDRNLTGITLTMRALVELNKPNLFDLLNLHANVRGVVVSEPSEADTVFSVERGTPYEVESIASEFMA